MKKWRVRCWYDQGPEDYLDYVVEAPSAFEALEKAKPHVSKQIEAMEIMGEEFTNA